MEQEGSRKAEVLAELEEAHRQHVFRKQAVKMLQLAE